LGMHPVGKFQHGGIEYVVMAYYSPWGNGKMRGRKAKQIN
jgi:hypothetical protein